MGASTQLSASHIDGTRQKKKINRDSLKLTISQGVTQFLTGSPGPWSPLGNQRPVAVVNTWLCAGLGAPRRARLGSFHWGKDTPSAKDTRCPCHALQDVLKEVSDGWGRSTEGRMQGPQPHIICKSDRVKGRREGGRVWGQSKHFQQLYQGPAPGGVWDWGGEMAGGSLGSE